jgi:tRNA uridine 5-carboxymethylaminomethyl modification enzyme
VGGFFEKTRIPHGTWGDAFRNNTAPAQLPAAFNLLSDPVRDEVLYRVKYRGYLLREERHVEKLAQAEKIAVPSTIDYTSIPGLKKESAIKLAQVRPATLGQAGRISGVTPADISILMVMIELSKKHHGRA